MRVTLLAIFGVELTMPGNVGEVMSLNGVILRWKDEAGWWKKEVKRRSWNSEVEGAFGHVKDQWQISHMRSFLCKNSSDD